MGSEIKIIGGIIITPLLNAKKAFDIALKAEKTELNRDASIQRFEFTFELCWKTLKRILHYKGTTVNSPRDVIREAAAQDLISDPVLWFGFLEDRSRTVHTYNEKIADQIYHDLPKFQAELDKLIPKLLAL